jgi:hypothetical protein
MLFIIMQNLEIFCGGIFLIPAQQHAFFSTTTCEACCALLAGVGAGPGLGPWAFLGGFTGLHQLEPSLGNSQHAKHVAVKFKVNSAWVPPTPQGYYIYI